MILSTLIHQQEVADLYKAVDNPMGPRTQKYSQMPQKGIICSVHNTTHDVNRFLYEKRVTMRMGVVPYHTIVVLLSMSTRTILLLDSTFSIIRARNVRIYNTFSTLLLS